MKKTHARLKGGNFAFSLAYILLGHPTNKQNKIAIARLKISKAKLRIFLKDAKWRYKMTDVPALLPSSGCFSYHKVVTA